MPDALNVIGKPYHNDANLLAYAFDYAQFKPIGERAQTIIDYVKENQSDRRFTVKFRACDSNMSSAIIEYRHKRYHVYGIYNPIEAARAFYVEYAYR